jgi:Resolvase, N terminal domain
MGTVRNFQSRYQQTEADIWITTLPLDVLWGIYAGQSTAAQLVNNQESTEMQTEDLQAWLISKGVARDYISLFDADLGLSGTLRIDQRTGLQELVSRIEADLIKAVLVYQISRLFRDDTGVEYNTFANICKQHDCILVTADGMVFNFHNRMHLKMYRFLAEYAAEYIPTQIGLLHAARLRKARKGFYVGLGATPSGYIVDYNKDSKTYKKLIPYEPHAERVLMFLERFYAVEGNMTYLCRELGKLPYLFPPFESWVDPRNVSRWKRRELPGGGYTISRKGLITLLCNPVYLGWWIVKGDIVSRNNHTAVVDTAHEYLFWYAFDNLSDYTVTGEVNEKCLYVPRRFYQRDTTPQGGLLKDKIAASGYIVYVHKGKNDRYHYGLYPESPSLQHNSVLHDIVTHAIDDVFEEVFFDHMRETRDFDVFKQWVGEVIQKQEGRLATIRAQLEEIDHQEEAIIDDRLAIRAHINEEVRNAKAQNLQVDTEALKRQLEEEAAKDFERLQKRSDKLKTMRQDLKAQLPTDEEEKDLRTARTFADFQTELEQLALVWHQKPFQEKKEFVNLCVTKAEIELVTPHWLRLTIYWKHPAWGVESFYIRRSHGGRDAWTEEEKHILLTFYQNGGKDTILELLPDKSWQGIMHQARNLQVRRMVVTTSDIPENLCFLDWQFMQEHDISIDEEVVLDSELNNTKLEIAS